MMRYRERRAFYACARDYRAGAGERSVASMVDQLTRNALNDITDQMERLRAAVLEADDQETVGALDDLTEAINDLKLALGQGIDSASPPPETA